MCSTPWLGPPTWTLPPTVTPEAVKTGTTILRSFSQGDQNKVALQRNWASQFSEDDKKRAVSLSSHLVHRVRPYRRFFDSSEPEMGLLTMEDLGQGFTRRCGANLAVGKGGEPIGDDAKVCDTRRFASTVDNFRLRKTDFWVLGQSLRIDNFSRPSKNRKMNLKDDNDFGYWTCDWAPVGKIRRIQSQRSAFEWNAPKTHETPFPQGPTNLEIRRTPTRPHPGGLLWSGKQYFLT